MGNFSNQSIPAIGKSKTMFLWTAVKRVVGISAIVAGFFLFGMSGLLAGVVFHVYFSYAVNIGLVSKYIGYKWWKQLLDLAPIMLASVIIAILSYVAGYAFQKYIYANGLVIFFTYAALYLLWSFLFKPEAFGYVTSITKIIKPKTKNKNQYAKKN